MTHQVLLKTGTKQLEWLVGWETAHRSSELLSV